MANGMTMGQFSAMIRITTLSNYKNMQSIIDNSDLNTPIENRMILLPVSPSDLMFNESSDAVTVKLMNYGELPVKMNRKLTDWTVASFFPNLDSNYPFVRSADLKDPYEYYCSTLFTWKNNQTPLVFMFKTWGEYYSCQIKSFKYGRKDAVGNVYYEIQFQEYKEISLATGENGVANYSSNIYYPKQGETILDMAKKIYGSSEYYKTIMSLNNLSAPVVQAGVGYKVK